MTAHFTLDHTIAWHPQVQQWLAQGSYTLAIGFYEREIEINPDIKSNYWYLGLLLLLQEQEAEAQTTWFVAITDGSSEQVEEWSAELLNF